MPIRPTGGDGQRGRSTLEHDRHSADLHGAGAQFDITEPRTDLMTGCHIRGCGGHAAPAHDTGGRAEAHDRCTLALRLRSASLEYYAPILLYGRHDANEGRRATRYTEGRVRQCMRAGSRRRLCATEKG